MLKYILLILFLENSFLSYCQVDSINNDKIIQLYKAGVSLDVILKKINTAVFFKFNMSTDELIRLKNNKLPDTIVLAMLTKTDNVFVVDVNKSEAKSIDNKIKLNSNLKLPELQQRKCYITENGSEFKELPYVTIPQNLSESTQASDNLFFPRILNFSPITGVEVNGSKSALQVKSPFPKFFLVKNTLVLGSNLNQNAFIIKAVVGKNKRNIPFNVEEWKPKKNSSVSISLKKYSDNIIEGVLDKKLPPGSYILFLKDMESLSGMYEFDIL